jgi:exportin-1
MLLPTTNIKEAYKHGRDDEQNFIQNLALFLCTFLKDHKNLIEKQSDLHELLLEAMHYLVLISEVEETEIFKICLEYWNALASELYRENPFGSCSPLLLSRPSQQSDSPSKRQLYDPVLHKVWVVRDELWNLVVYRVAQVRHIMISHMGKPEEVLVVENDQGEVVREFMKDTDAINLYKNMRETLGMFYCNSTSKIIPCFLCVLAVYLTHLDYADTENIMTEKLHNHVNGTEFSWKSFNHVRVSTKFVFCLNK